MKINRIKYTIKSQRKFKYWVSCILKKQCLYGMIEKNLEVSVMHGGYRNGVGRKSVNNIRKPITIYLDDNEKEMIENSQLPSSKNFSQKCRELIYIGLEQLAKELKQNTNEVRYIDLFCGLGGIRLGFEQALREKGLIGKCVFSSDIKPAALKAYKNYFGEDARCDITKVRISNIPNFEFLLAGFPCQAFSQAGLGMGFQDTRGTLFFDVAKILMEKKPLGFVLENVEGLVNHDKGRTFKVIVNTLIELGYSVETKVLNGKDFGLAQSRNRIYFIGYRGRKVNNLENFTVSHSVLKDIIDYSIPAKHTFFTEKLLEHYKVAELYGKSIKDKRGGDNNIHSWDIGLKGEISDDQRELLELLLRQRRNKKWADIIGIKWMDGMPLTESMISTFYPHENLHELLTDLVDKGYLAYEYPKQLVGNRRIPDETLERGYNIVTGKLSFEYSKILSPNDVTPTLVATDIQKLAVPVQDGLRTLSINEGLKLFGYPEDYNLEFLKEAEAFDLLGNTVCVPVIKAVSEKLLDTYLEDK